MNTNAVHESIRLLPPDSAAFGPKTRPQAPHMHWAEATNDPHWAWRIAVHHHQSLEPLPASLSDPNVRRAYRYLEGARDDQVGMAHSIRTSLDAGMMREVLQGLLCARDISLEGIASLLELDLGVVKLYEDLFFNVRNRGVVFAVNRIFP